MVITWFVVICFVFSPLAEGTTYEVQNKTIGTLETRRLVNNLTGGLISRGDL